MIELDENLLNTDIKSLCRACLQRPENTQLLDWTIIYDEENQLNYAECFNLCMKSEFNAGENLPQNLCKSCGLEIRVCYDFYKKVEAANVILQKIKQISKHESLFVVDAQPIIIGLRDGISSSWKIINNNSDVIMVHKDSDTEIMEENAEEQLITEHFENEEPFNLEDYELIESADDEESRISFKASGRHENGSTYIINSEETNHQYSKLPQNNLKTLLKTDNQKDASTIIEDMEELETWMEEDVQNRSVQEENVPVRNFISLQNDVDNQRIANKMNNSNSISITCHEADGSQSLFGSNNKRKRHKGCYSCDYCCKVFPNYSRMTAHRRLHDENRPKFTCNTCGRMYSTKQALEVHDRTMHAKTGYSCTICSKIFATKKSLEVHIRYHTGDFPYVCDMCGKKFAQMCHLNTHRDVKHNSVRFSCDYPDCGKFFTSTNSLRNHEFSHTAMPFECSICHQGYPAKAKLKIHIKRKHGRDLSKEDLERMRKFHVMRSKVNMIKVVEIQEEI